MIDQTIRNAFAEMMRPKLSTWAQARTVDEICDMDKYSSEMYRQGYLRAREGEPPVPVFISQALADAELMALLLLGLSIDNGRTILPSDAKALVEGMAPFQDEMLREDGCEAMARILRHAIARRRAK